MKRLLTAAAAIALIGTFAVGTAASAQPYGNAYGYYHHHDRGYYDRGHYDRGHYDRGGWDHHHR